VATDYDGMAGTYEQHAAESSYNAHYDRPAALELVGEVAGLRVLDAGWGRACTPRSFSPARADLVAVDGSVAMVGLATGERSIRTGAHCLT